tara:strand:+ start:369 stop:542 length:174 start_codon:yes stop_codon:yes gene_type:complete
MGQAIQDGKTERARAFIVLGTTISSGHTHAGFVNEQFAKYPPDRVSVIAANGKEEDK